MHNMIFELGRDRYELRFLDEAKSAVKRGMFICGDGEEREFTWSMREAVGAVNYGFTWVH